MNPSIMLTNLHYMTFRKCGVPISQNKRQDIAEHSVMVRYYGFALAAELFTNIHRGTAWNLSSPTGVANRLGISE